MLSCGRRFCATAFKINNCPTKAIALHRSIRNVTATQLLKRTYVGSFGWTQRSGVLSFSKHFSRQCKLFYSVESLPDHIKVTLPALSPTMQMGTILAWEKKIGDELEEGGLLAQIETDKATMDWETPEVGYLAKILVPEGAKDIPVGKLVCILVENKEDIDAFKDFQDQAVDGSTTSASPLEDATKAAKPDTPSIAIDRPAPTDSTTFTVPSPTAAASAPISSSNRTFATPLARTLAAERGIQLDLLAGSGPDGQIRKEDVLSSTPATPSSVATAQYVDIPVSGVRKVIASRLSESKQTVPHYYLTIDIKMDEVMRLRQNFNEMAKDDYKLSINDFIIKASATAMKTVPEVNSAWHDTFIRQYETVDISIAVDTDNGLITPIVVGVERKGLINISADVLNLAQKARSHKLKPEEFQGGTFTISNLGMFGIKQFTAIINPPQACILAVGTAEKRVIPGDDTESGYSTATYMSVTLSCDHRVVDGAVGARWLSAFKKLMEKPETMLL